MSKVTIAAVALAVAVCGGTAYADDNSMSRWTGNSYNVFEAARVSGAPNVNRAQAPSVSPDNGTSRWGGDSYASFEQARTAPAAISVAEARMARVAANRELAARNTTRGRGPVNPFRDDTGA